VKNYHRKILAGFVIFSLVGLACGLSIPGKGVIDSAATSVAETVNALSGTAVEALTALPHDLGVTPLPGEELPTVSPSGMVYPIRASFATPDGSLYTWLDGSGAPTLLISSDGVTDTYISPDGALVAFTRYSGYDFVALEVINSDGTNRRTLLSAAQAAAMPKPDGAIGTVPDQIGWIPGTHMLSMGVRHFFEGPGLFRDQIFYKMNANTGELLSLLDTGNSTWQFVWSPDGQKVAISNPTWIDIYSAHGVKIAGPVLTYPFVNTASEYAWTARPLWAEDGSSLIARIPPQDPFFATGADANSAIWQISAADWTATQVDSATMLYNMRGDTGVSPDLSRLLYLVQTGPVTDNTYNLILSNLDGSDVSIYASGHFQGPLVWAPESERFFYSIGDLPSSQPYIGQAGSTPLAVSDFTNPVSASWIDPGRYLVSTNDGGRQRLLLGTVGAATGVIFDSVSSVTGQLTFSVNR